MKTTTAIATGLLTLTISLATSACGSSSPTDTAANAPTSAASATVAPATTATVAPATTATRPSQLVDGLVSIDNGQMRIRCVGSGAQTVLLIAGWDDGGDKWGAIEPAISERARVCSYSKFGTGTSDAPSSTQTFETEAVDLYALLDAAGEPGPYVVLGHSFGGAVAVTFASKYADEVSGLVLLDASPTSWPTTVCSVAAYEGGCAVMHDPTLSPERLDVFRAFEEVATITSLGDLPMTVITAAHRTDPALAQSELARLDAVWAEGVDRWAGLSSSSSIVSVEDTGHNIEVDQPQLVIQEVMDLLA